ncbi:hypothetical protein LCGC14_1405910 [marine sediment metagenome]|uniref:Uncharacterized protein n=1 Tax=marine sediment metagenome TaxID=412755 RepID=A0A0F9MX94_9ZZZZ
MACRARTDLTVDLLSEETLRADLVQRTSVVRGVMFNNTHRIRNYNWYTAGVLTGSMPSVNEMADYGTVAALAYYDEGMTFGEALQLGIKMMSAMAQSEGKGAVTRARRMLEDGHKYGVGSFPTVPTYQVLDQLIEGDEDAFDAGDVLASLPLEPKEVEALLLRAETYTLKEIDQRVGHGVLARARKKAKEAWS